MPTRVTQNLSAILGELTALLARVDGEAAERLADAVLAAPAVFFAGAGRSGLVARAAAMRLMHLGVKVYVAGEIITPAIAAGDLLLLVSGSGETGGLTQMARKAKEKGAALALVTGNPASTLAGLAGKRVVIPVKHPGAAAGEYAETVQPMGNLFEQGAFLFLEAVNMAIMARLGLDEEEMFARHANLE